MKKIRSWAWIRMFFRRKKFRIRKYADVQKPKKFKSNVWNYLSKSNSIEILQNQNLHVNKLWRLKFRRRLWKKMTGK